MPKPACTMPCYCSHASEVYGTTLRRLRLILSGAARLQPSYILALRIVVAFAISKLDFIHDSVPPVQSRLLPIQRAADAVLSSALRIPKSTPKAFLHAPLRSGGFGE